MIEGACNCNTVRFAVSAVPKEVFVCHCSICRRSTGSGGIAVVIVNNDDFSWLSSEEAIATWHKPGHDWQTSFCRCCGSPLPGKNDENHMYVPASLLNQNEGMRVAHHLWVESKACWQHIGDQGVQHPQGFGSAVSDNDKG